MSTRIDRANSEIKRCIANIIQNKMNDPRLNALLYVSDASVTPDFKYCKVKIAYDGSDEQISQVMQVLNKSEGFIKRELALEVKMPQVPHLIFELDKGTQATIRVNEILKTLNIPKDEQ